MGNSQPIKKQSNPMMTAGFGKRSSAAKKQLVRLYCLLKEMKVGDTTRVYDVDIKKSLIEDLFELSYRYPYTEDEIKEHKGEMSDTAIANVLQPLEPLRLTLHDTIYFFIRFFFAKKKKLILQSVSDCKVTEQYNEDVNQVKKPSVHEIESFMLDFLARKYAAKHFLEKKKYRYLYLYHEWSNDKKSNKENAVKRLKEMKKLDAEELDLGFEFFKEQYLTFDKDRKEKLSKFYENNKLLGADETIFDKHVQREAYDHFTNLTYENKCPFANDSHEWSELKSSLLINAMIEDKKEFARLSNFVHDMTTSLIQQFAKKRKYDYLFKKFVKEETALKKFNEQKKVDINLSDIEELDPDFYPVSQQHSLNLENAQVREDLFIRVNFFRYLTENYLAEKMTERAFDNVIESMKNGFDITYQIRQTLMKVFEVFNGVRIEMKMEESLKNNQVGITTLKNDILQRRFKDQSVKVENWIHPGKAKCFVPYRGGLGRFLKENQNTVKGSRLCGISASTQYFTFGYLLSLLKYTDQHLAAKSYEEDITDLIKVCCIVLVGDGGHNIREVIYGMMTSLLFVKYLVDICLYSSTREQDIEKTFQLNFYMTSTDEDGNKVFTDYRTAFEDESIPTTKELVKIFINSFTKICKKWKPFLKAFQTFTQTINFTHISRRDPALETKLAQSFSDLEQWTKETIMNSYNHDEGRRINGTDLQLLFALDQNRYIYSENSFQSFVNKVFEPYLSVIESQLDNSLKTCKENKLVEYIPFAF